MNEEDDGADTARNQIGNLPCFDYAQITHTDKHTHSYRCAHTYSQHIVDCVIGSYTHSHTHIHPPAAGESFALELGLKRAICILFFSLSSLSASALPISLLVTSHHKTKKKTKKPSTTTLSLCLQRKRERESGRESVKERKHSKLVSRLSNFKVSALRAFHCHSKCLSFSRLFWFASDILHNFTNRAYANFFAEIRVTDRFD